MNRCVMCGCTDERACVGADDDVRRPRTTVQVCGWIDAERDLCTSCATSLIDLSRPVPPDPQVPERHRLTLRALRYGLLSLHGRIGALEEQLAALVEILRATEVEEAEVLDASGVPARVPLWTPTS